MNIQWKKLLIRATVWSVAELFLAFMGLDDLADYNEYVFQSHASIQQSTMELTQSFPDLVPHPVPV
jgi:hypothetical protein